MVHVATTITCDHQSERLRRIGIQRGEVGLRKLYLLMCPRCGTCISTYSIRKHRAEARASVYV